MLKLACLAAFLSLCSALYYKDVTPANFDSLIDSSKASVMLEFYAPWCGHCKTLAPEYEKLGAAFEESSDVIIAQINADKHKDLAKRFNVNGFPTLKWVPKGSDVDEAEDVQAGRTSDELLEYINGKTGMLATLKGSGPSRVTVLNNDNFDSIVLDNEIAALVMFFTPDCAKCKAVKPVWESLAYLYADEPHVVVGSVDCEANKELKGKYGITTCPSFKYFGRDGEAPTDYSAGRKLEDFISYVNEKADLDISPDGGVMETGGLVMEVSGHVKNYVTAGTEEERAAAMASCQDTVGKLGTKAQTNFEYYKKVLEKIGSQGMDYVRQEKDRLTKMLESSESLKSAQRKGFLRRLNVLKSFDEL